MFRARTPNGVVNRERPGPVAVGAGANPYGGTGVGAAAAGSGAHVCVRAPGLRQLSGQALWLLGRQHDAIGGSVPADARAKQCAVQLCVQHCHRIRGVVGELDFDDPLAVVVPELVDGGREVRSVAQFRPWLRAIAAATLK